jgi:AGCS family alanine or glycine:cation symporter
MGGMGRIASFAETVVPIMAGAYILGSLVIIALNLGGFITAIKSILIGAFTPGAIGGGALGITVQQTVRYGLARGLFSNEAGVGSTPHSHAVADVKHPAEQGFAAMIGVFISTFLICTSTVMVNTATGAYNSTIPASVMVESATVMTQNAFTLNFGSVGGMFLSVCLSFFSLTTIIGWYFFAESNVKFLFNTKPVTLNAFKVIVIASLIIGTLIDATFVWELVDMTVGLMAIPNIIALFALSKDVRSILDDYDSKVLSGNISWEYKYQEIEAKSSKIKHLNKKVFGTTMLK